MKNKFNFLLLIFAFLLIFSYNFTTVYAQHNTAEIVMEYNSKRVLYEDNIYQKLPMASTTKIVTAITVLENIDDISRKVLITDKMAGIEGSSIYLQVGNVVSIEDLLYGLMLRSGNDCAVALALTVGGTIENFAVMMNNLAIKVGANNSNFTNPHGLPDDNHYTTAYDLAVISSYAMHNEIFRKIVSTDKKVISVSETDGNRLLVNKNKMLRLYDGANGIKTGYTKKAGRCLVSSAFRDNMQLISVVLNCPDMWQKSAELMDNCFNKYKMYKIFDSKYVIDRIIVNKTNKKVCIKAKNDIILPLTEDEYKNIVIKTNYEKTLNKGFTTDTKCGEICVYSKNRLLFCENIFTIIDVK